MCSLCRAGKASLCNCPEHYQAPVEGVNSLMKRHCKLDCVARDKVVAAQLPDRWTFLRITLWPEASGRPDRVYLDLWRVILSAHEASLLPREAIDGASIFTVPWHAEALGIANVLMHSGMYSANEWAAALGAEARRLREAGEPDTDQT
jgi:hypothetical protein